MRTSCVLGSLALLFALVGCDSADPSLAAAKPDPFPGKGQAVKCLNRNNDTVKKLTECVTLENVRTHQAAFQAIADANGGTRVSGTPGYDASVDYVRQQLEAAGYAVTIQPFTFTTFIENSSSFERVSPPPAAVYVDGTEYDLMAYSGSANETAPVEAVDLALADPNLSTSGCEASDFTGFIPGNIALVQRGACTFQLKAENAEAAGAVAVLIMNQGNTPGREGLFNGTLTSGYSGTIPAMGIPFALGQELAGPGVVVKVTADVIRGDVESTNVLAETRTGDPDNVIMVGAHLDSVSDGPGINDNGSGSAALLETALRMAKVEPLNKVRFAWWGAKEAGLIGSDYYVNGLSAAEKDAVALYLNFDMIGSPNYVRFVLDGDGSAFGLAGPAGSEVIESFFSTFYGDRGLGSEESEIAFRSDYSAFFTAGIPFGGVFTGAEGIKTDLQAAVYGGLAGEQFDPCYHLACDTFDNVSLEVLDLNADAVAAATIHFAMSPNAGLIPAASSRMRPHMVRSETARLDRDPPAALATE